MTPLADVLRGQLPAEWVKHGDYCACLDVCGMQVGVAPPMPPIASCLVEAMKNNGQQYGDRKVFGAKSSTTLNIIDAVVECVVTALLADRPVSIADVPWWAHNAVIYAHHRVPRDGTPWALYEALVREIGELAPT